MGNYQQIDHTADIALQVTGKDLEDLFRTASKGWRQLVTGGRIFNPKQRKTLRLQCESLEELLVECLSELNYLFMGKQWLFGEYHKLQILQEDSIFKLLAVLQGESLKDSEYQIETEIKAVTFHQLQIRKNQEGYKTTIVFDI